MNKNKINKSELAKHFLKQATRPGLRVLSLSLLAASAYATTPVTPPVVFTAGGTFDNGIGALSGTITLDTTGAGGVVAADLLVDNGSEGIFTNPESSGSLVTGSGGQNYWGVEFQSGGLLLNVDIALGTKTNLDGYTGGALCADNVSCANGAETSFTFEVDPPLGNGQLTAPQSAVPEPSSLLLILSGAAGVSLATLRRYKRN